ncbi:MAG TPA: glycosyltransferase family 87 protein [Candidatus Angelobacter sp.]|nr:glycosyltransferase family 87 protein [Candidatus Angelobacter sp.]
MSRLRGRIINRSVLTFAVLSALAVNQLRVALLNWGMTLWHPGFSDFGNYYLYARVGLHQGWNHLYDTAAQQQEWLRLGGDAVIPWFPIVYPPPLAWIVVPFTVLPLPLAFACWSALLVACLLLTWRLVAPRHPRLARWSALTGMLAIASVPYALLLGQVLIIELTAVAVAWWLLRRDGNILAGIVLIAILFKPQIAMLLPVVLLVIGRWKAVAAWLAGSSVVAAIALITTGLDGVHEYIRRLGDAASAAPQFFVPTQLTIAGFLGRGPLTIALTAVVVVITIVAARRNRLEGPSVPVACALVGSLLITPYLHEQDLTLLLLAGGIALHSRLDQRLTWMLAAGYVLLLAISYWGFGSLGPILGAMLLTGEAGFLLMAALIPISGSTAQRLPPFVQVPVDRSA